MIIIFINQIKVVYIIIFIIKGLKIISFNLEQVVLFLFGDQSYESLPLPYIY